MGKWEECCFLEGESQIRDRLCGTENILMVVGKGFDPRAVRMLEILKDYLQEQSVWLIDYKDTTARQNEDNASRSRKNAEYIKSICKNISLDEKIVSEYSGQSGKKVLIISESVREVFTKDAIERYENILVDVSAMPRSVSFSIIKRMLDIKSKEQKLYILATENSGYDDEISPKIVEESAQYLPGFNTFSMSSEADDDDVIWLPALGMNMDHAFDIIVNYLKAVEICPLVPFPSKNIRRSENILRHQGERLFREYGVEKRNIIYIPERYPILVYKKLCDTVHYYKKALEIDESHSVKFVFSSQSSKLIDIGIFLAAFELTSEDVKVGIVVVENEGYDSQKEYNSDNEELFCLCLDKSEFDW